MLIGDNRYYENLPSGWSVSTLSQITSSQLLNDGDWILSENMVPNGDVKLIQLGSIGLMRYIDKGFKYLTEDTFRELSCVQIFSGYMLINRIISDKMYACILPQLDGKLITTVDTCWIAPKDEWYNLKYLMYFISSTAFQSMVLHISSGTTRKRISKSDLIHLPICFPPLSEQQRIVTRIDELFAQVDIIEQNQADIDTLYDEFRKRTLTLAIQGKLIPQDSNDEPASILLKRIRAEKKAKLGKKFVDSYIYKGDDNCYYEHIAARAQDELLEVPFDIPDNWAWVRWGNLSFSIQYGYNAPAKESGRIKMVRISDIHNNEVDWDNVPFCDISESDIKTYLLKENDILFARTGGTVGKSYLVTSVPEEAIYAGYLIRTQYSDQLSAQYLKYFMESSLYWVQLKDGTIATAQPNCNGQTLSKMILPLPPLAEQKRIVAKINEIFAML